MAALQIFHRDIGESAFLAHIIDRHDIRMIEAPRSFGLPKEPRSRFGELRIAELAGERDGFDRDQAIDGGIAAQVDDAHGAAADFALELVAAETLRFLPPPAAARAWPLPRGAAAATRWAALAGRAPGAARGPRAERRRRRGRGLRFDAFGIHQTPQPRAPHRGRYCRCAPDVGTRRSPGRSVRAVPAACRASTDRPKRWRSPCGP